MRELFWSSKINFLNLIIIIFLRINSINSSCSNGDKITEESCFNNLIIIHIELVNLLPIKKEICLYYIQMMKVGKQNIEFFMV